ncbi:MAG: pyridoxamine 5'-phosphate oxidase family protein [Sphingobacteriales bacterium]|nr:MAG: pyridoxamine 5'-phosphate oxidase family protein [Sphingobacteriales bacterium]
MYVLGYLACARDNRPYVVPIHYAFEAAKIYGFSMPGRKTDSLKANPHACMHVDDLESQDRWHSVLIEGGYTELPDTPECHNERIYAWSLLQKHDLYHFLFSHLPKTGSFRIFTCGHRNCACYRLKSESE